MCNIIYKIINFYNKKKSIKDQENNNEKQANEN